MTNFSHSLSFNKMQYRNKFSQNSIPNDQKVKFYLNIYKYKVIRNLLMLSGSINSIKEWEASNIYLVIAEVA